MVKTDGTLSATMGDLNLRLSAAGEDHFDVDMGTGSSQSGTFVIEQGGVVALLSDDSKYGKVRAQLGSVGSISSSATALGGGNYGVGVAAAYLIFFHGRNAAMTSAALTWASPKSSAEKTSTVRLASPPQSLCISSTSTSRTRILTVAW